jgi:hypothetical protein
MQPIIAGTSDLRLTDAGRAAVTEEARRALMDRLDVIAARTAKQIEETGSLGEGIELRCVGCRMCCGDRSIQRGISTRSRL